MILTNRQRGDLIDALGIAIENLRSYISSNLPPKPHVANARRHWTQEDKDNYVEWNGQIERFTKLRKAYLKEEGIAMPRIARDE